MGNYYLDRFIEPPRPVNAPCPCCDQWTLFEQNGITVCANCGYEG